MNFYIDVITKSSLFNTVAQVNDIALLEPVTRAAVQAIIADAKAKGVNIIVGETYRSKPRQQLLFTKGVTKLKAVGVHHFGLACDLWITHNGHVDWKADYKIIGPFAKAHKVVWGYDWGTPNQPHTFRDIDHIQRCAVKDQDRLFAGTFYPDANYNPLAA
jgi:hypothetical protein